MTITEGTLALQLRKIDSNPGILPVKEGQAFKQEDRWVIAKILDLSGIKKDLNFNIDKYSDFNRLIDVNQPYIHEFSYMKSQVEYIRDVTIQKFSQLIPSYRVKRGLLNPLGSIVKLITGNLDHEDAMKYDSMISDLNGKQSSSNKKITLISKMLDNLILTVLKLYMKTN